MAMSSNPTGGQMRLSMPGDVELVIIPRAHDLGGFEVRRALPSETRQMIGPFIFFDQMGPGEFLATNGLDLRPQAPERRRSPHRGVRVG